MGAGQSSKIGTDRHQDQRHHHRCDEDGECQSAPAQVRSVQAVGGQRADHNRDPRRDAGDDQAVGKEAHRPRVVERRLEGRALKVKSLRSGQAGAKWVVETVRTPA